MSIYPRPPATPPIQQILDAEVARYAAVGWTLAHRGPTTAVVTSPGGKVNHILHFLLSLLCFLWVPVWIVVAVTTPGPSRLTLTVHPNGAITVAGADGKPAGQRSWLTIIIAVVITVLVIVVAVLANAG